ncbi:dolichyl-phosphate-mannose-protein mannosyltransferase [Chthoniobacter flavus]|nr:glycosyltransferase family 39 protein [Chthoniobacter flavus]TCO90891.1 dolichyl-phosphate-mannose-protein mannosyltransferase [Chthoniobacter flavus]
MTDKPTTNTGIKADSGPRKASHILVACLCLIYLALNISVLIHTSRHPDLVTKMESKDSRQYIEIAQEFARGDFRMSYVQTMPHRQPLYPLLLAPAVKFWGDNPIALGSVNLLVGLALLICFYYGVRRLFQSDTVAAIGSLLFIGNPFMVDKIARRLMTEPSHALVLVILILLFLGYVRTGRPLYLLGIAAAAGLDYLSRTNGLFGAAATLGVLFVYDLWRLAKPRENDTRTRFARTRSVFLTYLGAAFVLMIVTIPTWLPRYQYFHNPVHHGYLSNFMWVDSYEEGHTGQIQSEFTWKDYAKSHSVGDFFHRWAEGFYRVYYDIPRHAEHIRVLYFLSLLGIVIAFAKRRWEFCVLAACLFIQLLPIVWTSITTPGPRVAYGTLLPFELFFATVGVSFVLTLLARYARRVAPARFPDSQ